MWSSSIRSQFPLPPSPRSNRISTVPWGSLAMDIYRARGNYPYQYHACIITISKYCFLFQDSPNPKLVRLPYIQGSDAEDLLNWNRLTLNVRYFSKLMSKNIFKIIYFFTLKVISSHHREVIDQKVKHAPILPSLKCSISLYYIILIFVYWLKRKILYITSKLNLY